MKQVVYEIYNQEGSWTWLLRSKEQIIAYSGKSFSSSSLAWREVDRVRALAAKLAGVNAYGEVGLDGTPSVEIAQTDAREWQLTFCNGEILACSAKHFELSEEAHQMRQRILEDMIGAVKVFTINDDDELLILKVGKKSPLNCLKCFFSRGKRHRELLDMTDIRIDVVGIRGKSSTVQRICEVLTRRGYNTLAKITGNRPQLVINGHVIPIERIGPNVMLYENIHGYQEFIPVIESYTPDQRQDVAIIENQAITEYTTRMVNEVFVRPNIIVITNVRQDHLSTLGRNKREIARAFARAVPEGCVVINCEQNPILQDYMKMEIEKRGARCIDVEVPAIHRGLLGAETIYALNYVMKEVGSVEVPFDELDSYIRTMQPRWTLINGSRIFNAAQVNDVESTEMIRQQLSGTDPIVPFLYLRDERRGRSYSFVRYLNHLYGRGYIKEVFMAGPTIDAFARNIEAPVRKFSDTDDPSEALDQLIDAGLPIILMGNTVSPFMRKMELEIFRRVQVGGTLDNASGTVSEKVAPLLSS